MANQSVRKTYFGAAALLTASLAFASLVMRFVVAYLRISPSLFSQLNALTTQVYCMLAPLALTLGVLGIFFKNDSKLLAWAALALVTVPFLIIFAQFILALVTYN
ncbi:MAG: hypothetical protein IH588_19320 [Anaerolineales bacterium]|nr:hypothetical protein [Anaerolineales bacterium]